MADEKDQKAPERGPDRRSGDDRRKLYIDPADLPFPDRRKGGDRRQMDRRVTAPGETEELLKRILPTADPKPADPEPEKPSGS